MAIATRKKQGEPFILPDDRALPLEKQTQWDMPVLTARALAYIQDAGMKLEGDTVRPCMGQMMLAAVRVGVSGWRNLPDETGAPIEPQFGEFDGIKGLTDETLSQIAEFIPALGAEVINRGKLSDTDRGNSGRSPGSQSG